MTGKNIHLINIVPPFRVGVADMTRPPSGLLYVGGYLKEHGFFVKVHHIREAEIDRTVEDVSSDNSVLFAGFSVKTGKQVTLSALMSSKLKKRLPDITIVWGGIHPSLMPEESLNFGFIDFVVIGEGEITVLELADYLANGRKTSPENIAGIVFKKEGKALITPPRPFAKDIDIFRQDWDLVDLNRYVRPTKNGKGICFITSRGCPHSCGFCYNQTFNLKKWRGHSADTVVNELLKIKEATGINYVTFDDDNFFTNRNRGFEILRRLKQHGITCRWVEIRVDYITEEVVSTLVELGVEAIFMGWESGSENSLEKIAKGFTPQLILEKIKILSKFKELIVDASAIVGFPWETETDINETISMALKMFRMHPFRLNFNIGIYVPYPGAPIIPEAKAGGFSFPENYEGWSKFDILAGTMELPWLSRKQILKYTTIDRYAKLLFVYPKSKLFIRWVRYTLAALAYMRLKTGIFIFPFETWLLLLYQKIELKYIIKTG